MTNVVTDWTTMPIMLTPEEARHIMRCGRNQIYELIRRNECPHVRIGAVIRVPREGLRRLLEGSPAVVTAAVSE